MRFKRPKKPAERLRRNPFREVQLVAPGDVLVCGKVSRDLPERRCVATSGSFFRLGWLENARLLAFEDGSHYVLVINVASQVAADRVRQNLLRNPVPDLELCEPPEDVGSVLRPYAQVMPHGVAFGVTAMLASDPVVAEEITQLLAKRMDEDRTGDYLIPNLLDEEYAAAKKRRQKKPH